MVEIISDIPANLSVLPSVLNNCVEEANYEHEGLQCWMRTIVELVFSDL